ncbi:MAG: hypothetical protein RL346_196 [Verrucomicrobiota bacterium]|jgi:rhodanese-related sulfurtransferase
MSTLHDRLVKVYNRSLIAALFAALVSCEVGMKDQDKQPEGPLHRVVASKPVNIPVGSEVKGTYESIGIGELFELQQTGKVLLYDVRVPYFYQIDHIPGAINWPHTWYDEEVQKRDIEIQIAQNAGKKVVLYCFNLGCSEARNVAKKLTRRGYSLYVFSSGIDTWREAGLQLDR